MRGREARQIEQLNGHGEGSVPRVSRGNAAAPTTASPRNKREGLLRHGRRVLDGEDRAVTRVGAIPRRIAS